MVMDALGIDIPLFIVTIFILAYLVWGKFLNSGKLKIRFDKNNAIDKVAELLTVFLVLLITFFAIPLSGFFVSAIKDVNLSDARISMVWKYASWVAVFLGIFLIFWFLIYSRKEKFRKKDLHSIILFLMSYQVILVSVLFGLLVWSALFQVIPVMTYLFLFLLIAIFLCFWIICYQPTKQLFPKMKLLRKDKIFIIILIVAFSLGTFILAYLNTPGVNQNDPVIQEIRIYDPPSSDDSVSQAYSVIITTIDILNFGRLGSYFNIIPIRYGDSGISLDASKENEHFYLILKDVKNKTVKIVNNVDSINNFPEKLTHNYGFTTIQSFPRDDLLALRFNKKELNKTEVKQIILSGIQVRQITGKDYLMNYDVSCEANKCFINIILQNNLKFPVWQNEKTILNFKNFGINNVSDCRFDNNNYWVSNSENKNIRSSCKDKDCIISDARIHNNTVDVSLFIDEDYGVVELSDLRLKEPTDVSLNISISC